MAKYSEEFKLKLVMEGQLGYERLAKENGMEDSTPIKRWVRAFEVFREKGLIKKKTKENNPA